ncbi:LexA family transcriptional regulator, partial [Klebsiella pneumoniae subsp. pneumoniae]
MAAIINENVCVCLYARNARELSPGGKFA